MMAEGNPMPDEGKHHRQYNIALGIVGSMYLIGSMAILPMAFENGAVRNHFLFGYCIAGVIFAVDMFVLLAIRSNRPGSVRGFQSALNIILLFGIPYGTVVGGYYFYRIRGQ
jgi:hypothetical protein